MRVRRIPLRVVFYQEDGDWIAHCLEFDLCGDGPTKEGALDRLTKAIAIQINETLKNGNSRNLFSPADGEYFEKFAAGKDIAVGKVELKVDGVEIESTESREWSEEFCESDSDLISA